MGFESNRKRRTVKTTLMQKGDKIGYQEVLEGTVGDLISRLSIYDGSDDERAILVADCDYEIIIRPKK